MRARIKAIVIRENEDEDVDEDQDEPGGLLILRFLLAFDRLPRHEKHECVRSIEEKAKADMQLSLSETSVENIPKRRPKCVLLHRA